MLSIMLLRSAGAAAEYYEQEALVEYYGEKGNALNQWGGRGAKPLKLHGMVEKGVLGNLLQGRSPDGTKALVQNAGSDTRQAGWDLTFNAPKSMSAFYAVARPDLQRDVEGCQSRATGVILTYAEDAYGLTRRGAGGKTLQKAKLIFAQYLHRLSRAREPHVHTHAVVPNISIRADSSTGTVWSQSIFDAKMLLGAMYRVQLAAELRQCLDLSIRPDRFAFRIEGVPEELCRTWSSRAKQIKEALANRGLSGAVAAKVAALATRAEKIIRPFREIASEWQKVGQAHGFGAEQAQQLIGQSRLTKSSPQTLERALREAWDKSPFKAGREKRFLHKAARLAIEHGADGLEFRQTLERVLGDVSKTQQQRQVKGQPDQSTPENEKTSSKGRQQEQNPATIRSQSGGKQQKLGKDPAGEKSQGPPRQGAGADENATKAQVKEKTERQRATRSGRQKPSDKSHQAHHGQDAADDGSANRKDSRKHAEEAAAYKASPEDRAANKAFLKEFLKTVEKIVPEKQTRPRLERIAEAIGHRYGANPEFVAHTLQWILPGDEAKFIRLESRRPFHNSPIALLRNLRVSMVALGDEPRKWDKIHWRLKLLKHLEVRVQDRRLFPSAPRWNPASKLSLPALRFTTQKPDITPKVFVSPAAAFSRDKQKNQNKDAGGHKNWWDGERQRTGDKHVDKDKDKGMSHEL